MATTANQKPVPMASTAKVMTALAILKKYPLKPGETGPTITMTAADVDRYNNYINQGGSAVRVEVGEQMTEYQALQAIMLPSANNIADSLAIWAYGSMGAYLTAANQLSQSLGMTNSTFAGDASGLLPESVSTAHDLVLLGQAAMANSVLKEIAGQKTAVLPLVGTVSNVNVLLGRGGIIGIKTGNTDEAGGCYLFAATRTLATGQSITSIGAIMAAPSLGQAMTNSLPLLDSFYQNFSNVVVVPKGTVVARYSLPWNNQIVPAVTAQDATVLNWRGSKVTVKVSPTSQPVPQTSGAKAGTLLAQSSYGKSETSLVLANPIPSPPWQWRIWRK
jgi:D-alanyl-D-alanine carboxypeptidase (penicillin-binding protein 5/6)